MVIALRIHIFAHLNIQSKHNNNPAKKGSIPPPPPALTFPELSKSEQKFYYDVDQNTPKYNVSEFTRR